MDIKLQDKLNKINDKINQLNRNIELNNKKNNNKIKNKLFNYLLQIGYDFTNENDMKLLIGFAYFSKQKTFSEKNKKLTLHFYDQFLQNESKLKKL